MPGDIFSDFSKGLRFLRNIKIGKKISDPRQIRPAVSEIDQEPRFCAQLDAIRSEKIISFCDTLFRNRIKIKIDSFTISSRK